MIPSLSPQELVSLMDTAPDTLDLIDVRGTDEFAQSHISTSRNIPLHILPIRIRELDPQKKIIFICRSGGRSAQAALFAAQSGITGYNLSGGINELEKAYPQVVVRPESHVSHPV